MTLTQHWSEGYAVGSEYPCTYFAELNPARSLPLLLNAGLMPGRNMQNACELGFGTGLSTAIHTAASSVKWWGTDFSPSHAQFANDLCASAGIESHFFDQSFAEFCCRTDLPDFDFIALHGVWTWVSSENRSIIIDFVRRKLKVGGIVYVSYNTLPGFAQMLPVRNLMKSYFDRMTSHGRSEQDRAQESFAMITKLFGDNPHIGSVYPLAINAINSLKSFGKSTYISHEYLNDDWTPMSFCEVAQLWDVAKMRFACSATPTQLFDEHFLSTNQSESLNAISDPTTRETFRDYLLNRGFRKDYWIKGGLKLSARERDENIQEIKIVLTKPKSKVSSTIVEAVLDTSLNADVLKAVLSSMNEFEPVAIADIVKSLLASHIPSSSTLKTVICMIGNGDISPCQEDQTVAYVFPNVVRMNDEIIKKRHGLEPIPYLASALTGSAVPVSLYGLEFLALRTLVGDDARLWATMLWERFQSLGQVLIKDGLPLPDAKSNMDYLTDLAQDFLAFDIPMYKALKCIQ